jgi:hypothetical protein|tara:strand:- start:553 stop:1020 length:468 start_codon:yes stop_codon:yes gene_type:complete
MKNFAEIDANRIATPKQIWAVANRFATMTSSDKSERYGLTKVFNAILNSIHGDSAKLTHADIQSFFECETVPKNILSKIKSKKVSKKPAKAKKVSKKPEPEIVDFVERTAKPAKPIARVQENSNVKKINARIDSLESKISNIETGLAQILNHLAK